MEPAGKPNLANSLRPPQGANPAALDLWFQAAANVSRSMAYKEYVKLCNAAGLPALVDPQHRNPEIRSFLMSRRKLIVRMLDQTKMLQGIPIFRRAIKRTATVTPRGFSVTISTQLRITDPTWVKTLTRFRPGHSFGLTRNKARELELRLDPSVRMFVYNDMISNLNLWHVGYTVTCPIPPDLTGCMPGHEEEFVLDLWAPAFNKLRPSRSNLIYHI